MRQRISELETLTTEYRQIEADQTHLPMGEETQPFQAEKLYQIGMVLNSSLNYETVLDDILDQIGQLIPHDAACILLVKDDEARIFRWHGYARLGVEHSFALRTFKIAEVPILDTMQVTGKPLLISTAELHDPWLHGYGKHWVKSHLDAPICIRGQIVGFLSLDSATPGFFNESHVDLLQHFIGQAALALGNAQMYDQARQEVAERIRIVKKERNFVSAILNTTSALVMVLSPQGRILRLNRAYEQTTDYSLAEVRGQYFWDVFVPLDEARKVKTLFQDLQANQDANEFESYWLTKTRKRRLISWSNSVLLDHLGQIEYIISTGIDITEQRQLKERLLAIHQLGRELNLLRDEVEICKIALETAAFLLQIKSSGYGMIDRRMGDLKYVYYPIRGVPSGLNLRLPLDREARINTLLAQRQKGVQEYAGADEPLAIGHSWLSAPMQVRDRTIGVLDVESYDPYHFTPYDQQLLQTLADQTAVALENARLHHEAQKRVDELTALSDISQTITSTLNLESTLTLITNHTIRLMDAMAASVALCDETKGDLWFHAASGGVSDSVRGMRLPAGQGIVGWVIQQGQPVLVADVAQDPRFFNKFDQMTGFTTQSVICVPLQSGQQVTGAIEVMNKKDGAFTEEDLRLLTWLATPASIAIENARLFEAEHMARDRAERLQEATATLTSTLDLDQVLDGILVQLAQVVLCDNACVLLQRENGLQVVAWRGISQTKEQENDQYYSMDSALYQEIQKTGRPVIIADAQDDPRFGDWDGNDQVRGWMGVPLMVQNKVIGCLTLESTQSGTYGQAKAALAQAFANQAAVAIQNARLFRQVRIGHKQLQSLSRRLVEVQETERRHIARELHDEAGQALTSLMVGLRLLEGEVDEPETIKAHVVELKQITNDVSENLHRLAMDLRPASLDYLGLVAALRQYIEAFGQQHDLAMHFEAVGLDEQRLPPAIETNLYRITQEALTNVARHAQASRVDIFLERRPDQVVIIVEDDGVGFDPETVKQQSRLGLLGMRERTEMLNGTLVIESTIGTGTTIYVEVPYEHSHSDS
jgi:PAS domain S-box-containing protein